MDAQQQHKMQGITAALTTSYEDAVALLEQQPQEERGAIMLFHSLNDPEHIVGQAKGTPEQWAEIMVGMAEHSEDFKLALAVAYHALAR